MNKIFQNTKEKNNFLDSIKNIPLQCYQVLQEIEEIKFPSNYYGLREIIICGMGGSALGADFLRYLFYSKIKRPIIIINDYHLPKYVSNKSLVIISSYSGNTEESISCYQEAIKKKCKIIIITSDGKLSILSKKKKIPAYIFKPKFNSSQQPRMGLGYSILAQLIILNNLKYLKINKNEIKKIIDILLKNNNKILVKKAQNLAKKIKDKIPLIIAAEFLSGNAHILCNQINENAKNFADYFLLPELNHHLLEGLEFPKKNKENLIFLFLESNDYSSVIKKRILITKKILKKNNFSFISYFTTQNKNKLLQGLETLIWGTWLSFYLSQENNANPVKIPYVDYFKKELKKIN